MKNLPYLGSWGGLLLLGREKPLKCIMSSGTFALKLKVPLPYMYSWCSPKGLSWKEIHRYTPADELTFSTMLKEDPQFNLEPLHRNLEVMTEKERIDNDNKEQK